MPATLASPKARPARIAFAAALLALLTSPALSQTKREGSGVQLLQPHTVRTSLHQSPAATPVVAATAEERPRDICLKGTSPAETLIAACSTLIEQVPRGWRVAPSLFTRRAEAYRIQGDVEAAITDFDRAIKLEPRKPENFLGRGQAYMAKRDTEAATRDFSQAIRLSPRQPAAILQRAQAYRVVGDLNRALGDYDLLVRVTPNDAQAYYHRAVLEQEMQEYRRALDDFGRMIELDRANVLGYFSRARILYDLHQYERTVRELDRLVESEGSSGRK